MKKWPKGPEQSQLKAHFHLQFSMVCAQPQKAFSYQAFINEMPTYEIMFDNNVQHIHFPIISKWVF